MASRRSIARLLLKAIPFAAASAAAFGLGAATASAATIAPPFASDYALTDFGSPTGVPGPLGGITFLNNNTLLIGGAANGPSGAIYSVGVTRAPVTNLITGFSGPATLYASAPYIDGGLMFGPGGVLFYTGYSTNTIGQIKPGDTAPARVDSVGPGLGGGSVGTMQTVPAGFAGAGNIVVGNFNSSNWGLLGLAPDGSGTYDLTSLPTTLTNTPGGPEGIVYVPAGSPVFSGPTALVSLWGSGLVQAFALDANGLPTGTGTDFVTGLSGAEGAVIDPVTGAFLFSTFGGGDRVLMVSGFAAPPPPTGVPEPASALLLAGGLLGLVAVRRRRHAG